MRKIFLISITYFVIGLSWLLSAQDISFNANVNSNNVALDEQFQVSFSLNASGKNFQAPSMPDFTVLSGPNQSSSVQIINGSMSQSISYTYYLMPKATGTFTIGAASIVVDGKTYKSSPVKITVSKSKSGNSKGSGGESLDAQLAKNIFIKATANKTNPYVGEGITVTYKLYTRVDLVDFNLNKMPTLNGFWSQDVENIKQLKLHQETLNGVLYNVADIKKTILFPLRAGKLSVDAMEANSIVRVRTQRKARANDPFADFFDDPFFGGGSVQDVKYVVKSEPISVNVKAHNGIAPPSFKGAVGQFTLTSFLDKSKVKANEPLTLKIKISGKGNLKLLDPLELTLPPDFETYEPKLNDNISIGLDGVKGSRTFEYLLIPRRAGSYKINPISFAYFNLEKAKFEILNTETFIVNVEGTANTSESNLPIVANQSEVSTLGNDIRYIHTQNTDFINPQKRFYGSWFYYGCLSVAPIALLVFIVFRRKQEQEAMDVRGTKTKKATKVAKARLATAEKLLKQNNDNKVFEAILQAFWGYIADKYQVSVADLNKEKIREILSQKGKSEDAINTFIKIIDDCEFARYAPAAVKPNAREVYSQSINSISNLE